MCTAYCSPNTVSVRYAGNEALVEDITLICSTSFAGSYEGWNFNSGNYLFTTDTK